MDVTYWVLRALMIVKQETGIYQQGYLRPMGSGFLLERPKVAVI
jgi:hypothetical protein